MTVLEAVQQLGTPAFSFIGAVTASLGLWLKLHEGRDKIKVSFGSSHPPSGPGEGMYVVSQNDHHMEIINYGFIDESGRLLSVPQENVNSPGDADYYVFGKPSFDERGERFEIGEYKLRDKQIGAFAITATQEQRTISLCRDLCWHRRLWISLKIRWCSDNYQ